MTPEDKAILLASLEKVDRDGNVQRVIPPEHAIKSLEDACAVSGLDWKMRHCYLMNRGGKWRVELSIDGFRSVANADPEYAGSETFWAMSPEGPWTDIPPDKTPYAAKVNVFRKGHEKPTVAQAKFASYCPKAGQDQMWRKFPETMIAKCAEMLALRKAFPARLGGLYGAEEMAQADKGTEAKAKPAPKAASGKSAAPADTSTQQWSGATAAGETATTTPPIEDEYQRFCRLIDDCTTLDTLKSIGKEISNTNMGLEVKMQLNVVWKKRKAELESSAVRQGE